MAEDIDTADRLARIETKLDNVLTIIPNYDTRIRDLELKKEECKQDNRLDKIETRLDDGEKRFDSLEKIVDNHITTEFTSSEGKKEIQLNRRETLFLLIGLAGVAIAIIEMIFS